MAGTRGLFFYRLFANSVRKPLLASQRGIKHHVAPVLRELKVRQEEYFELLGEQKLQELTKRSNFLEWNFSAEVYAFGKRLHENIPSELLVEVFTHRSYIVQEELKQKELGIENPNIGLKDNSELVFIGEKIISEYVTSYVSHFLPRFPLEGIKGIHDYLTSEEVLSHVSKNIGTNYLILSADYPVEKSTFSKTLQALVGAIKVSGGIERSRLFVRDFIITQLAGKDVNDFLEISNPLETLGEILKRDGRGVPEPRIICKSAVNTILANYHVGIYSNKELIGHCSGETIHTAINLAAFDALKRLFLTTDSHRPISYDVEQVPDVISNIKLSEWRLSAFEKPTSDK